MIEFGCCSSSGKMNAIVSQFSMRQKNNSFVCLTDNFLIQLHNQATRELLGNFVVWASIDTMWVETWHKYWQELSRSNFLQSCRSYSDAVRTWWQYFREYNSWMNTTAKLDERRTSLRGNNTSLHSIWKKQISERYLSPVSMYRFILLV
jgi:tagatose-1,6-bisphosphate aldolase non-catalytic subunit AgaZ/GatZ